MATGEEGRQAKAKRKALIPTSVALTALDVAFLKDLSVELFEMMGGVWFQDADRPSVSGAVRNLIQRERERRQVADESGEKWLPFVRSTDPLHPKNRVFKWRNETTDETRISSSKLGEQPRLPPASEPAPKKKRTAR